MAWRTSSISLLVTSGVLAALPVQALGTVERGTLLNQEAYSASAIATPLSEPSATTPDSRFLDTDIADLAAPTVALAQPEQTAWPSPVSTGQIKPEPDLVGTQPQTAASPVIAANSVEPPIDLVQEYEQYALPRLESAQLPVQSLTPSAQPDLITPLTAETNPGLAESAIAPLTPASPQLYAQATPETQTSPRRRTDPNTGDPDVLLDVPNLSVEEITLDVENLRARVSLDAQLANLLRLTAGADASIDKVKLTIRGVQADVLLKVRLDNVAQIIDRTLSTIDRNPQILTRLLQSVDNTVGTVGNVANTALQPGGVVDRTVGTVGNVANTALQPGGVVDNTVGTVGQTLNNVTQSNGLLSQTVNSLGQTVQQTVDSTGSIVETTLNTAGQTVNTRNLGSVLNLPVVSETKNSAGQTVRRVRDRSGRVIELTLNSAGQLLNSRILNQATGR